MIAKLDSIRFNLDKTKIRLDNKNRDQNEVQNRREIKEKTDFRMGMDLTKLEEQKHTICTSRYQISLLR